MIGETIFSKSRSYRYTLWREWIGGEGYAMFIGLNPSTADEVHDDPTVRRCIAFAKGWGYSALCMMNAFAFRATDPNVMKRVSEPIGVHNDSFLEEMAKEAGVIVAAWGIHGTHRGRDKEIVRKIPNLHCLGTTKSGQPRHPLFLKGDLIPIPYV